MVACRKCIVYTFVLIGSAMIIAGIVLAVRGSFNDLAKDEIKQGLPLKTGSKSYENWEKPEGEFFIKYYMFNITNSDELTEEKDQLPKLKQIGPYTYRTVSVTNVLERKNQTITYRSRTVHYFDKSRSCKNCNDLTDKIITINYPLLVFIRGASQKVNGSHLTATGIKLALDNFKIGLCQTRTVNEILWGYKDQLFQQFTSVFFNSTNPLRNPTYALQFNNTNSYAAKIYTGEHDVDKLTQYIEWNGERTLPWWNSVTANMINGTDGSRFKPFIKKSEKLYVLITEICRSLKITYDKTVVLHGIDLYRFTSPKEVFESGDINRENKGFCVTGRNKKCLPSGLLDINGCKGGHLAPPFVASAPHFYFGDANLTDNLNLKPAHRELHETFVDVEPNTGLSMRGHKRLQLNMFISSFSIIDLLLNSMSSKPVYLPVFFTDKSAQISEEDADTFKKEVLLPLKLIRIIPFLIIGFGALLWLISIIIMVVHFYKLRKQRMDTKDVPMSSYSNGEFS